LCQWLATRLRSQRPQFSVLAQARHHRPQDHRSADRHLCIKNRRPLLHNDGDFHPIARHLGLIEVPATA
jgi:hypothetical protein